MSSAKPSGELAGIEILRFLAAFGVLAWHYQHFFFVTEWDREVADGVRQSLPFYWLMGGVYDHGHFAVEVFWIISGFIFMWRYHDQIAAGAISFQDFALRRFARLYPLHFVTLLLVAALQFQYARTHAGTFIFQDNSLASFVAHLGLASNWLYVQTYSFNGPIWSVSVEVLIYGLFFGVARRYAHPMLQSPVYKVSIPFFLVVFLTMGVPVLCTSVLNCGVFFLCGAIAERVWRQARAVQIAGAVLAVVMVAFLSGLLVPNGLTMLFLGVAAVILAANLERWVPRGWLAGPAHLGNATYSSYLIHFPVQITAVIAVDALGLQRSVFLSPVAVVAYFVVSIGGGLLIYHYFEMPAQNFLRRLASGSGRRLTPIPAE